MTTRQLEEDDRILKDGERRRVPLQLMDSVQRAVFDAKQRAAAPVLHRPGSVPMTGDVATAIAATHKAMLADADKKLSERWRDPPTTQQQQPAARTNDASLTARALAHQSYDKRISEAWRA